MQGRRLLQLVGVAAIGGLAAVAAGRRAAMPGSDLAELLGWAALVAGIGGLAIAVALRAVRGRSVTAQIVVLITGAVALVAGGAWLGARAMFFSAHDLDVLAVMLLAAGTVSTVTALLVGGRFARELDDVARAARRLGGESEGDVDDRDGPRTAEVARLVRELDESARRLAEAREREQLVERSRRELVAWISHDLRTPLAGIRAVTEALEDGVAEPDARPRYYATLRHEAIRLGALIDDLFELSRAQAGVLQLEMERLSLRDIVSDVIAGVAPVAERKGVRLVGNIDPAPEVLGSAPELLRALRNIVENAVRHTPADGSVVIESGHTDDGVFVAVRDDGGGVGDAALARVFDAGFRGDDARTPGGGAGLGLAIARSFVEAHRGDITVRNENGGACFTVWLPLAPTGSR